MAKIFPNLQEMSIILRNSKTKEHLAFIETNACTVTDMVTSGRAIWTEPLPKERIGNDPIIKGQWNDTMMSLLAAIRKKGFDDKVYDYEAEIYYGKYDDYMRDEEMQKDYYARRREAGTD